MENQLTAVLPMWEALRSRFTKMAEGLQEEELDLSAGGTSVRSLLKHTAEVEFMFAEWYLSKKQPGSMPQGETLPELLSLLSASNEHVKAAMQELPADAWDQPVEGAMGVSTPAEAVARLMYHAGLHAGQIALMKKGIN